MAKLIKIFLPLVSGICTIIAAISAFRTNGVAVTVLTVFTGFISIWTAVSPFLDSLSIYRIVQEVIRYVRFTLTGEFDSFEALTRYQHALRSFRMTSRTLNSTELHPIPSAPASESALSLPSLFAYEYKNVHDRDSERVESTTTSIQVLAKQATSRGPHKASPAGQHRRLPMYGEDTKPKTILSAHIAEGYISVTPRPKTSALGTSIQHLDWQILVASESNPSSFKKPRVQAVQDKPTAELHQDRNASGVSSSQQSEGERREGWFNRRWDQLRTLAKHVASTHRTRHSRVFYFTEGGEVQYATVESIARKDGIEVCYVKDERSGTSITIPRGAVSRAS